MFRCLLLLAAPMAIAVSASAADDVVRFDFEQFNREALRAAIDDLISTFGDRYPRGHPQR